MKKVNNSLRGIAWQHLMMTLNYANDLCGAEKLN